MSLQARYGETKPLIISHKLPDKWKPDCCLLEGMLMIITILLSCHKTMFNYSRFLFTKYVILQFSNGIQEVHIIFDNPCQQENTPKQLEQIKRDTQANTTATYACTIFISCSKILPNKLRDTCLKCRQCKRKLVNY